MALENAKKELSNKCNPVNLFLESYNYDACFGDEESFDTTKTDEESTDVPPMLALEGDEVNEGKGLNFFKSKQTTN